MDETHIILRGGRAANSDVLQSRVTEALRAGAPAAEVSVEVAEMNTKDVSAVARDPDVVAVAPAIPMKLIEPVGVATAPVQPRVSHAWGIAAVGADTSPFTGAGIIVAVLDTGIDRTHPAFTGVEIIEKDFTGQGNGDADGHGTHCAGTLFGRDTDGIRIGVARGVRIALIGKVVGTYGASSDKIVNAIQWAVTNGAHVVSMSLGLDFPGLVARLVGQGLPPALATSRALEGYRANVMLFERLASLVRTQGMFMQPTVIVAAAGNESQRDQNPTFEIGVSPPAVSEGIISVAALAEGAAGLTIAPFSNTGATIAGPGVEIVSAKAGGGLVSMNGTSMACPHVAGVAALWADKLRLVGPFTGAHVTTRLVASGATDRMQPGFHPFDVGTGLVRAPQA